MKNIKITLILILSLVSLNAIAQNDKTEKREQIKALKVAFITDELKLSTEEAAKFWPLYNAFETKQLELRKIKISRNEIDNVDQLTEKEAVILLSKMIELDEDLYQNKKKFFNSLKGVLPTVKIIKLKRSEERFNKKLLHQFREKIKQK